MGARKRLTEYEQGRIKELADAGHSHREIAGILQRSQTAVSNFLNDPGSYNKKNRGGRPKKISPTRARAIKRTLKKDSSVRATQLAKSFNMDCSAQTVRRLIKQEGFSYGKRRAAPLLQQHHKTRRLEFARKTMEFGKAGWARIIFSDEKRFNLDGPDGCQYHWHHPDVKPEFYSKRQNNGGGIMVWAAISAFGQVSIVALQGKVDAKKYVEALEKSKAWDIAEELIGSDYKFMQDNASVHVARSSREYFASRGVRLLDWPARSPDLNPVENVWGIMVNQVYQSGTQYYSVKQLETAVYKAWTEIDQKVFKALYDSMPDRIFKLIQGGGSYVGY